MTGIRAFEHMDERVMLRTNCMLHTFSGIVVTTRDRRSALHPKFLPGIILLECCCVWQYGIDQM
jgi:hypothetical protein